MKTLIAATALSLLSVASFAKSAPVALPSFIDGLAYEMATNMFMSQKTRAEVLAELKAAPRAPGYTDGVNSWAAQDMFMSRRSVAEVRAEAAAFVLSGQARRQDVGHS